MGILKAIGAKKPLRPTSKLQREIITEIEEGVINDKLLTEIGDIDLSGEAFRIYTITSMFMRSTAIALGTDEEINVCGLFTFYRDRRDNTEAEKTGNLVGAIEPGEIIKSILRMEQPKLDSMEITTPSFDKPIKIPIYKDFDESDKALCLKIQTGAANLLSAYKLGLAPSDWIIYLISFLMLKHSVLVSMKYACASETHKAIVNIADTIEMTIKKTKEGFDIDMKPGKEAKLEIKGDHETEIE